MAKSPETIVDAGGRELRVSSPDRVIFPGDRAHGRGHQARHRRVLPGGRRRDHARAAAPPDDARALAQGRAPGHRALDARAGRRRRVLPEADPARARPTTSRPRASSSRRAATPTRSARPRSRSSAGPRRWARSPSTRGRCAATTSTIRTSCASTSTRSPAPTSPTPCASPARRAALLDDLGYAGFPKTSGGRGVHIYVRIEPRWTFTDVRHAAIAFGRELERRLPGRGDDEVVEGGARRADLRRLQPERARPHDRLGLQHPAEAGRAGVGAADVGRARRASRPRTSRSRRCRRASPRSATATPRSTTSRTRCSRCSTCTSATRPRAGRHALSARLPEDAGRAQARAALARPRPAARLTLEGALRAATVLHGRRDPVAQGDCGSLRGSARSPAPTAAARPGRCRRRAPRRGRRSPARGRSGPCPLRAWRSTQAAWTRSATGVARRAPGRSASRGPGGTSRRGSPSR